MKRGSVDKTTAMTGASWDDGGKRPVQGDFPQGAKNQLIQALENKHVTSSGLLKKKKKNPH